MPSTFLVSGDVYKSKTDKFYGLRKLTVPWKRDINKSKKQM